MSGTAPLWRYDTMFGVCASLGEDFGFNPNHIRALLGVGLLFAPVQTVAAYGAAGVVAGLVRWFVPDPAPKAAMNQAGEAVDEDMRLAA